MNRIEFFKEMRDGLFRTVKSVYEPFLKEDLEKFERATDSALGIMWYPVVNLYGQRENLEMKFVAGQPVILLRQGPNIEAMSGVCPKCSNLITITSLYSSGKCLNCGKIFNFTNHEERLQLETFPIRRKEETIFVGINVSKLGDSNA